MVDTANSNTAKSTASSAAGSSTTQRAGASTSASTGAKAGASTGTPSHSVTNIETLARTTEFRWFVAHALVVVSTLLTIVPLFGHSSFFYRLGNAAALTSFVIILGQKYQTQHPSPAQLLADDNVPYALVSLFWLFTPVQKLALLPLGIFSLFHTLTYTRSYLLPALGRAVSPLSTNIDAFIKKYNEPLTVLAANCEIALVLHLLVQCVLFVKGSWVQLLVYVAFVRVRFANSAYTRHAAKVWEIRVDQLFGVHPTLKAYWAKTKSILARIPGPQQRA